MFYLCNDVFNSYKPNIGSSNRMNNYWLEIIWKEMVVALALPGGVRAKRKICQDAVCRKESGNWN